jgi:hypothetical protein
VYATLSRESGLFDVRWGLFEAACCLFDAAEVKFISEMHK